MSEPKRRRRVLLLPAMAVMLVAGCREPGNAADSASAQPPAVIPLPARMEPVQGSFRLTAQTRVLANDGAGASFAAGYFANLANRMTGWELHGHTKSDPGRGGAAIEFRLAAGTGESPESYELSLLPTGVTVTAGDRRGLLYGAVTLWQLVATTPARDGAIVLPAMRIRDSPRFPWRGVMLDSARHYQSTAFIERFIDWMALHKLNVLHWHLTDDQAWRLEIRAYPRLTRVGAWRVPAGAATTDFDRGSGRPRLYGGFYTQEQVRELVRYAADRGVTILPEIEMPGHATAAIVAYPWLGVDGNALDQVPSDWGIYPNLFNVDERTFAFIEDVLDEVIQLFPGTWVHVGGDEAVKSQWESSPRVQQRMRTLGIADERALQGYFTSRVGAYLASRGRRLVGWDEILDGELPPDATVMSWRGSDGAVAAARRGHDAVLSPWPVLYFDHRQGEGPAEPPGRGRIVRLEDVYRFDPVPDSLDPALHGHILGVQANVWTEHIRTEDRVEWMSMPRAAALAEVAWTAPDRLAYPAFLSRLERSLDWYRDLGYRYSDTEFRPAPAASPRLRRSQELRTCRDKLVLNLEDDAPLDGDRAVFLVDIMEPCWIFEGAELGGVRSIAATVGQFPFNFQIGKDREAIRLRPPRGATGELEVRIDGCDGEPIAVLPLGPAHSSTGVTRLPAAALEPQSGTHDLCLTFTGDGIDPMWAIDSVELLE